ncbi:ABC transporter permease [Spiroplasma monobiae]|uniref:Efflux ABC transporter, permease protein n=1 Tax=Spiroplasma monobiae MQ-1 TaxID=1336748 RepID=A0A2K9LVE1_SPISQ|nr:ABC transporter permease [Spiroplasma monobiae]AUM63000.1 efflux ABC transporter, permease protein [Spiroplasma monobiae MQ-1]
MKKSNFFLLIKQGIKGVFRYKTQFTLIVILGFFASLILSVTNSINDRMTSEYNRTMEKVDKFDFYDEKSLETSNALNSKTMVPIMDFISNEYIESSDGTLTYNVNVSSASDPENKTFITNVFESEDFKNEFTKLINKEDYNKSWFDYKIEIGSGEEARYFNAYGMDSKGSNKNKTNYWSQFLEEDSEGFERNLPPLKIYTDESQSYLAKQISEFSLYTISELKKSFVESIKDISGQNSMFGIMVKNNQISEKNIKVDNFNYDGLSDFDRELNTYMDLAFLSIVIQINKMIHDYVQYHMENAIAESFEQGQEAVKTNFEIKSQLNESNPDNKNAKTLYKWLFGASPEKDKSFYETGANGQLAHFESNGKIVPADGLKIIDTGRFLENELKDKKGFIKKDQYNWENADIASTYFIRQKLLGIASSVNVYSRIESIYSDNSSEKHYRMILMDEWTEGNMTVYEGNKPRTRNEVLLNPQYAKANGIKIGSNIKIGDANLTVSGFAADPYTNFPIADLTVPFPNNKKGAIVYVNRNIVEKILTTNEAKVTTTNVYRFLTVNDKNAVEKNISLFNSLNFDKTDNIKEDLKNITLNGNGNISQVNKDFTSYKGSALSMNWELTPMVLKTFSSVSYVVCIVILAICLTTMLIAIKKTIQFNAGEIGIMKALGTKNSQIAFSYISYGLILLLFVVPLSWFIGGYAQESFCRLFLSYTGGAYNQARFNGWSLGALMLLFGGFTIIVSYITAILLINRPVLEIINKKETVKRIQWIDNLKLKMTKNTKFTTKFSIELAISGMKPTLISTFTILISSLLITSSMSIPGMVNTAVTSYYKNVKYANKIENLEPIGNSPLSKTSLSAWNGVDYYDQFLNNVTGSFGETNYMSTSVTDVTGINDYSIIPKFFYNKDTKQFDWALDKLSSDSLLKMIGYIFGNNIPQTLGRAISMADIQRILEYVIHDNSNKTAQDRISKVDDLSAVLSKGLPPILSAIFPGEISSEESDGWKEAIMAAILSQTPSYVKSFLSKSENRYNQYTFGWTFSNYVPGEDDFYTNTEFTTEAKDMLLTGIQSNQKAYNLKSDAKKMFLSDKNIKDLSLLLNGEEIAEDIVTDGGFKLYSKGTGTLNIPVTMNDQAKFVLNKSKGNSIPIGSFKAKRFVMSSDGVDIPNSAWVYDDNDWAIINSKNSTSKTKEWSIENYLDPSSLDTSKFTFANTYNYLGEKDMTLQGTKNVIELSDMAMAFADISSGTGVIRPYYGYDNLLMFIPSKYEKDLTALSKGSEKGGKQGWHGVVGSNKVPQKIKEDWNRAMNSKYDGDYIWIRPYSLTYDETYKPEEAEVGSELGNLLSWNNSFLRQNLLESKPGFIDRDIDMKFAISDINLVPVSTVDVYGSNIILADQGLTNLVHGYSTSKYTPYNYVYEYEKAGSYMVGDKKIDTYNWNSPKDLVDENRRSIEDQIWGNDEQKTYKPNSWFSGIMSQSKEPYFLTSQASFSKSVRTGEYTLSGGSQYYDTLEMKNVEFLSEQKALINQIANLVLTIALAFIVVIVITATLSMIIITDLYVNQYRKFMVVMKSLGYSNWKVIKYSFGTLTILAGIAMILGISGSAVLVTVSGIFIKNNVGSIPLGLSWWALLASTIMVVTSYITSILITTYKIRKESPVSLMK